MIRCAEYVATTRRRVGALLGLVVLAVGLVVLAAPVGPAGAQAGITTTFSYAGATVGLSNTNSTFNSDPCSWVRWQVSTPATDIPKSNGSMSLKWLDKNGAEVPGMATVAIDLSKVSDPDRYTQKWPDTATRLTGSITGDQGQTSAPFELMRCGGSTGGTGGGDTTTTTAPQVRTATSDDGSSARRPWVAGGAASGAGALLLGAAIVGYRRRPQDQ